MGRAREAQHDAVVDQFSRMGQEMASAVRAALDGRRQVIQQRPFVEPWVALALFRSRAPLSLHHLLEYLDYIDHTAANSEEVSWAFLQLRKRRWLRETSNAFGLTRRARLRVWAIVGLENNVIASMDKLEDWMASHPA